MALGVALVVRPLLNGGLGTVGGRPAHYCRNVHKWVCGRKITGGLWFGRGCGGAGKQKENASATRFANDPASGIRSNRLQIFPESLISG